MTNAEFAARVPVLIQEYIDKWNSSHQEVKDWTDLAGQFFVALAGDNRSTDGGDPACPDFPTCPEE